MATKDNKIQEIISPKSLWQGDPDAPVSLVMFGDYECRECARIYKTVKKVQTRFKEKLRFNYRHFPLTQIHQNAQKAAEAAVGAAQEGKFWEMHELLFDNQRRLGAVSLKAYAREAGATDKNFLTRLVDSAYGWTVRADLLEGLDLGIRQVPAFIINDELYTGKPTLDGLSKAIEEALNRLKTRKVA